LREASDIREVPRFTSHDNRAEHLVASIVALAEQTNRLTLDAAMDVARAHGLGEVTRVVEQVCRLAVGAGVAAGEVTWLVGELEASAPSAEQLGEADVAIAGLRSCMTSIAFAVEEVADSGGAAEIDSSAEALRRVAAQLDGLQARIADPG
jgi:methyl-accepting chemotaxis protein